MAELQGFLAMWTSESAKGSRMDFLPVIALPFVVWETPFFWENMLSVCQMASPDEQRQQLHESP